MSTYVVEFPRLPALDVSLSYADIPRRSSYAREGPAISDGRRLVGRLEAAALPSLDLRLRLLIANTGSHARSQPAVPAEAPTQISTVPTRKARLSLSAGPAVGRAKRRQGNRDSGADEEQQ